MIIRGLGDTITDTGYKHIYGGGEKKTQVIQSVSRIYHLKGIQTVLSRDICKGLLCSRNFGVVTQRYSH